MQSQTQRTILWVIFLTSLFFLYDGWLRHNGQPSVLSPSPASTRPTESTSPLPAAKSDASVPTAPASVPGANGVAGSAASTAPAQAAPTAATLIKLTSDTLAIDIDPTGGEVRRVELLQHRAFEEPLNIFEAIWRGRFKEFLARFNQSTKDNVVVLQNDGTHVYVAQTGFIGALNNTAFPTHVSNFTPVDSGPRTLGSGSDSVSITLSAEEGGLKVNRTYTLKRASYVVEVKNDYQNVGQSTLKPSLYMQLLRDSSKAPGESQFYSTFTGPVQYSDGEKFKKIDFGDIEKKKAESLKPSEDGWVGMIQHYFVSAWIPDDKALHEFYTAKVGQTPPLYSVGIKQPLAELAPGASGSSSARLLVGPQDQRMLEKVAPALDLTVDYGWLTAVAKPLFWLLEKLHGLTNNWGWAIVLLTIVVKLAFFPLQAASYRSMARMKQVTPKMMALREKYGDDRVKLNQAVMELYKTEKVNPLGGCLPVVVQIPVFIALYWVLLASVEMRNAPWIGWITDLATPDPLLILPLVMAGTMFFQTKLNPTPPDPVQAKMMTIMPLVFSVMFFFFPAGLVLYWLVNNIFSIAQQWVISRRIEGKPIFGRAPKT